MILSLDLGQVIGWIKGDAVGPMTYGSFEMPKTTKLGRWLVGSDGFFRDVLEGVDGIAVEQPFLGESYFPARKLLALLGHLHYWAEWNGISTVEEIAVASGKMNLAGKGNADADEMIAAAKARYGLDLDEHSAHALGIWDVYQFGKAESNAEKAKRLRQEARGKSIL